MCYAGPFHFVIDYDQFTEGCAGLVCFAHLGQNVLVDCNSVWPAVGKVKDDDFEFVLAR